MPSMRLLPTDAGVVLFITIPMSATESVARAHQAASELGSLRQQIPRLPTSLCTLNREARVKETVVVGIQRRPLPVLLAPAVIRCGYRPRCREPARSACVGGFRLRRDPGVGDRSVVAPPKSSVRRSSRPIPIGLAVGRHPLRRSMPEGVGKMSDR
jgi:hypothetical protein